MRTTSDHQQKNKERVMTNRIKIALAAVAVAALATPAAAQGFAPSYNYAPQTSYQLQAPSHAVRSHRLIEGRNAAVAGDHQVREPLVPDRTEVLGN
jgi:hypothetical protein